MGTTEGMNTPNRVTPSSEKDDSDPEVPSGFIVKLYQMVNEAPNDVISWTKKGDAFVIGSDITRLESETLPQVFRHNRFQSLVRQLNFYSFRKINRERNVWIYKHELFHRDHPENLYRVRRRTCPGHDGRKQRNSRYSTRRPVEHEQDGDSSSLGSIKSPTETKSIDPIIMFSDVKKANNDSGFCTPLSQKTKRISGSSDIGVKANVDTSMIQGSYDVIESEDVDYRATFAMKEKRSIAQQSTIVSEVAMKLDKYARKANWSASTSKKNHNGVVTPPTVTTSSLFTYDDEVDLRSSEDSLVRAFLPSFMSPESEPIHSSDTSLHVPSRMKYSFPIQETGTFAHQPTLVPPVMNNRTALAITNDIVLRSPEDFRCALLAPTSVVYFCMSTSPYDDKTLSAEILRLLASSQKLAEEFQQYLSALHPTIMCDRRDRHRHHHNRTISSISISSSSGSSDDDGGIIATHHWRELWKRDASRNIVVREFKAFAINCMHQLVASGSTSEESRTALQHTACNWRESIGLGAV